MVYINTATSVSMKIILLSIFLILSGCLARPVIVKTDDESHTRQSLEIEQSVLQTAKTGDWLVIRGYRATDNLVSYATGLPISHAGIYDAESRQIIEAEAQGVHISTLQEFVDKSYRLLIIRPRWRSNENAGLAWNNARRLVGSDYDLLGTLGFNYPSKYYCSELAVSVYKQWYSGKEKFPKIIKPGELYLYGEILYDSLPRDEI